MANGVIHRCTKECPYTKNALYAKQRQKYQGMLWCFINAVVTKEDIPVQIGKEENACVL